MKRILITLYVLASVVLTAVAQARFTSNTEMYSFGQIEWKHPVTVQYTITNTGDQPLVLTEVEPDCACSVAQWTKTPIAPGAKGTVNVTFDAKALGHFQKSVAIYSNAQPNLVYLKFNGEVVQEIKDFTKTHPYLIGQIRIDKNSLDFPDIQHGEQPVIHIGVVNLSDRPYEPVLMHLPPYLQTKVEPNVLQKGETVEAEGQTYTPDMVLGPQRKGIKLTYCTDTRPTDSIRNNAKGSNLFICEGMYGEKDKQKKAKEYKHMTFYEAASLAREADVGELWLTHYSPSLTRPEEYMDDVREIFPRAIAAKDRRTAELVFED